MKAANLASLLGYGLLALLATLLVIVIGVVSVTAFRWRRDDQRNGLRLQTLQRDGLLGCRVEGITHLPAKDLDHLGSRHGIGFGGTSSNAVYRAFSLDKAGSAAVMEALTRCAQANGWSVIWQKAGPNAFFEGVKTFPGGWQASLLVDVVARPQPGTDPAPYPIVEIRLGSNPEGV
jgi:hypothetical protein